jgi:hypothetical protein
MTNQREKRCGQHLIWILSVAIGALGLRAQEIAPTDAARLDASIKEYSVALDSWDKAYLASHEKDYAFAEEQQKAAQANYATFVEGRADEVAKAQAAVDSANKEADAKIAQQREILKEKLEFEANAPLRAFGEWTATRGPKVVSLISIASKNQMPYSVLADTDDPRLILEFVTEDSINGTDTPPNIRTAVVRRPENLYFVHLKYSLSSFHDLWVNIQDILADVAHKYTVAVSDRDSRLAGVGNSLDVWQQSQTREVHAPPEAEKVLKERDAAMALLSSATEALNAFAPSSLESQFQRTPQGRSLKTQIDNGSFPTEIAITAAYDAKAPSFGQRTVTMSLNPGETYKTIGMVDGALVIQVGTDQISIPPEKTDLVDRVILLKKHVLTESGVADDGTDSNVASDGGSSSSRFAPTDWKTERPLNGSDVNFFADRIELHGRGTIVSNADFRSATVTLTGEFTSSQDVLDIFLRSSDARSNPFGAPDKGVTVHLDMPQHTLSGFTWNHTGDGRQDLLTRPLPISVGERFTLRVVDNGSKVGIYVNDNAPVEFHTDRSYGTKVIIQNREAGYLFKIWALKVVGR